MYRRVQIAIFFAITCTAWAQVSTDSPSKGSLLVWQPPTLQLPNALPQPTVAKEMITTLRVAKMLIILEKTGLTDVQTRLGGSIGHRGDASEALAWLCFHGADANTRWALWLESSELGGGMIDGFALQRLARNAKTDQRCQMLQGREGVIELPTALRLGLTEMQVRKILGNPTTTYQNTLVFEHEHEETIHNQPFTASNTVYVTFRGGTVWAIQVWKDTTS